MILWLIIISLLNALCAVPMALRVRYDFALNGRVSLPIAVWSGVTVYVHLMATFALAWLDRGSPQRAISRQFGYWHIRRDHRKRSDRCRAPRICKSVPRLWTIGRQADYHGHLPIFAQSAVCGPLAHATGSSHSEPFPMGVPPCVRIRAHLSSLHNGCRGASPALRIRREVSRILQQDTPVPATQT